MTSPDHTDERARKIERIRKLLALATNAGASEHEAATALQKAQAQMVAEGISDVEILAFEASEAFTKCGAGARVPVWESNLGAEIGAIFACDVIHHGGQNSWSFVGIDPLPEIATYAFDVLRRQCLQARKEYIARKLKRVTVRANKTKRADLFCQGWVETAASKARRMPRAKQHTDAIKAFKDIRYGTLATLDALDRNKGRNLRDYEYQDLQRGRLAGNDAELRTGMGVRGDIKPLLDGPAGRGGAR